MSYVSCIRWWMLHVFRGSGGAGRLDTDHLLIPAMPTGAWTWGCDWGCTGRGARWGLGWRPGDVLRTGGNILRGFMVWGGGGEKPYHYHCHVDPEKRRSKHKGIHFSNAWTFCGIGGVGIAVLQLSRPLWHQRWRRWVLRIWQGIAQHQRLPRLATATSGFLLSLTGHYTLQLLEGMTKPQNFQ